MSKGTMFRLAAVLILPVVMLGLLLVLLAGASDQEPEAALSRPPVSGHAGRSHPGDLVISGTHEFIIEGETFTQTGNIYVRDQAKLIVRNGTLFFQQWAHETSDMHFEDQGTLILDNATIDSNFRNILFLHDQATAILTDSTAAWTMFTPREQATVTATNSYIDDLNGQMHNSPTDYAGWNVRILLTDCQVHEFGLVFHHQAQGILSGIRPNVEYADWDLQRDNAIQNFPYQISFVRSTVENWNLSAEEQSVITVTDSIVSGAGVQNEAILTLRDCSVIGDIYNDFFDEDVIISGLHPGHIDYWRLSEGQLTTPPYDLVIENCDIAGWSFRPFGGRLTIEDSTINGLRPWWDAVVLVRDSSINERLMFWDYWGVTGFENSVVADWRDNRRCDFVMTGTVHFEKATLVDPEIGPWEDATIHREYPVEVTDWEGDPLTDVALTLKDNTGTVVWTGMSGPDGTATFTLTFTETNYLDTWTLSAALSNPPVMVPVQITSDTPILIQPPVGVTDVTINGPTYGLLHADHTFTATVSPITATTPITYVWQATGQSPITHTGGLSDAVTFSWTVSGTQTITVTASNSGGVVTSTHVITTECDPTSPYICGCWQVTQPGDLVLTGSEMLVIDSITYTHHGNICLQDNAKLLIRNGGTLEVQLDYHAQHAMFLLDNASLEITDGSTYGPAGFQVTLQDTAAVTATNAVLGGAEIKAYNHASFYAIGSEIEHMITGAETAGWWPYEETDYATWELVDSWVGILCLSFNAWSAGTVQGLHTGSYSDWDLLRDNQIEWLPYNVILKNTSVGHLDIPCTSTSTLTLIDSQIGGIGIMDEAVVTLQDCEVLGVMLAFMDPPISAVSFDGLQPGHFDEWRLREPGQEEPYRFNLIIHNSDVNRWALHTSSTDLSVSNSTLGCLRMGDETDAVVDNSTIEDFWVWWYNGTVTFTNSIMKNWYETRWCDFWMKGTVTIEGGTIIQEANGPWQDAIIHREYPVEVTDWEGNPLAYVALTLKDSTNTVVWTGMSGADGTATFTLTFTETNYLDTWTLSAALSDPPVTVPVEIKSDTPIFIRPPVAVTDMTIDGLTTGYIQTNYTFTAAISPITATTPITYVWKASGQSPVTHTGGLSDTITFAWSTEGQEVITVTTANAWSAVTGTHAVNILQVSPTTVTISGPTTGLKGTNYTFTATVSPMTTTLPITYVWEASDQHTVTHTGGLSDTMSLAWSTEGQKVIIVTATNAGNMVTDTHAVNLNQTDALEALYQSTDGPNWTHRDGWLGTNSPCEWYGVSCSQGQIVGLNLGSNQLSGTIPSQLGNLTALESLDLARNQLNGIIASELGNLSQLRHLFLDDNQLSGSIPPQLGSLTALQELNLGSNQLSGSIPPELGNLSQLRMLYLYGNQLSGNIPPQLGNLTGLWYLALNDNQLSGGIPAQLGNLSELWSLELPNNQLSGGIPPELGSLNQLGTLALENNRLSGSIPPQIGNMTNLLCLNIRGNALEGEVPLTITNLVSLQPSDRTDFGYNKLSASDPVVAAFLNEKDPDWANTQTVPPTDVQVVTVSSNSVELAWTPVAYTGDGGHYEVSFATTPGGPYTVHGTTSDKSAAGYLADNLSPDTTYYFVVRTYTPAHWNQQNDLWSDYSQEVSATRIMYDLDEDASAWDVYFEGSPTWTKENVETPSIDGKSLRCSITGGDAYSNVHCYRNLLSEPDAEGFTLALSFWFSPTTTFNNQGAPSIVQALEVTMNKWHQSKRYEFALQWQNVGDGGPQWCYWDPHQPEPWVCPGITDELEGEQWHNLKLEGEIVNGLVHYLTFCIDQQCYGLDITVSPASVPGEPDRLAVAFQLDGNYAEDAYDVFVDKVSFVRGPCFLIGDLDGNGRVGVADIMKVASRWRCKCWDACYDPLYDLDHDCDIDIVDIMLVAAHWGETCE